MPVLWMTPAALFQSGYSQAASIIRTGSSLQDFRCRPFSSQLMRVQQTIYKDSILY